MDITGHFESASCVIEVDGSATLAQVKGKLLAELGMPRARHVGVRMRGGGDIGDDDLRICDTEMDEGCAIELYRTGANITPGLIQRGCTQVCDQPKDVPSFTLSPCDRYLAVMGSSGGVLVIHTETHERLCSFPAQYSCFPAFSPCSEWVSCVNKETQCAEVYDVKTGALKHSFGDEGDERKTTAWSPCGTKLLSWCKGKGLQVWDIATGVVVHEWGNIEESDCVMVVTGDKVATCGEDNDLLTVWDYTTGVEVLVLSCPDRVFYVALSPNQRFIAAFCDSCVRVWNIETGERVFEDVSENSWADIAMSDDIVAAYSYEALSVWSTSTGKQLWHRECKRDRDSYGLAISSCGGVLMRSRDEGIEIVDISHLS